MSEGRDLATKREWLANVKRRKCRQNRCRPSHVCEGISSGGGRWLVKCKLVLMPSKANYRIIPPPPLVCSFTGTRQGGGETLPRLRSATGTPFPSKIRGRRGERDPDFAPIWNLLYRLTGNWEI